MAFSMTIELEGGGTVTVDGVTSYTVEEMEPSPDEVPEDGDEEREGNEEVDMSETKNPMEEETEDVSR